MKIQYYIAIGLASLLSFTSCKPDEVDPEPEALNVPATYNFDNVSFSGQTTRLDMLTELNNYIKTANNGTTVLDSAKVMNMFYGSGFTNEALNTSGKQLADKTSIAFKDLIENNLKGIAATSSLNRTASKGTSGTLTSTSKTIIVDANGFEYVQLLQKGIMSSVFMDQALNNYLANILLDDNTSTSFKAGEGTAMAHHWDEAYGYLTDALDFPTSGINRFWGSYSNEVNPIIGSNAKLSLAFRTGRAAILANKRDVVEAQRDIIRAEWSKVAAAISIHYLNLAKASFTDLPVKSHALSEGYGFIIGVKVAGGNVDSILTAFETTGMYDLTEAQLTDFSNTIATIYGLKSLESSL